MAAPTRITFIDMTFEAEPRSKFVRCWVVQKISSDPRLETRFGGKDN